jgi:HEAT repeat protein
MILEASQHADDKKRMDELLESLSDSSWSARRDAVSGLIDDSASDTIQSLLSVITHQHRDLARLNGVLQVLASTPADVVPQLVPLLAHPDHDVRTYAALVLGDRGDPRAIADLLATLSDTDTNVRMHAVEALGKLRATAAVDALIAIVESMDFELAFPALDALIAIGDERIAYRLVPLLEKSLFKVLAIEALGALGDEEAIQPLLDRLADPDVPTADVVAALGRIHRRYRERYGDDTTIPNVVKSLASSANLQSLVGLASQPPRVGHRSGILVLSWLPGPEVDAVLLNRLDRPPIDEELIAALARRGPSIVPLLMDRLPTAPDDGRKAIVEALKNLGNRAAVPALLELLESETDEDLLVGTVEALARLGNADVYQPLRSLLTHRSGRVRQAAVAAITSLGHPNTAIDVLQDLADPSPVLRESAVRIAAYLGLPGCIDRVVKCCGDADERVRRTAIECLPSFDDERVFERLAQALTSDTPLVRAAAASALGKVENPASAGSVLAKALDDGDVWVRYFAIRSLRSLDRFPGLNDKLIQLAQHDPATQVRVAAIESLEGCGPEAIPLLIGLAASPSSDVAQSALVALTACSHPDAQAHVRSALHSHSAEQRIPAIRAIALARSPYAIETLSTCALGWDERIAREAVLALGQLHNSQAAAALVEASLFPSRRAACIAALASMSDAALPALVCGLRHTALDVRRAVVEGLSRIHSAEAVGALELALADHEPGIRHAALAALAHIRQIRPTALPAKACEG